MHQSERVLDPEPNSTTGCGPAAEDSQTCSTNFPVPLLCGLCSSPKKLTDLRPGDPRTARCY